MLWHEIVCDGCSETIGGFAGTKNYNKMLKDLAIAYGWTVKKDGTAYCTECQKRIKINI